MRQFREVFDSIHYLPHFGQLRFHASDARFKVLIAGARFGKSLAAARDVLTDLLCGPVRGWLVAPTYALAQPEMRYLVQDLRAKLGDDAVEFKDGGRSAASRIRLPWGAEVISLSARHPETLLGEELDWLLLCEAAHLKQDVFERFLRARLSTRGGRLVVPSTPRGCNWLHELYLRGGEEDWESFRFATADNPLISAAEIEAARATLPPETFDEQYLGAFTTRAGVVYREFQPSLHVADKLAAPAGAIILKSIDFGFTNPFCCLWATRDADSRILILREHYREQWTVDQHAETINAVDDAFRRDGCEIGPAWGDPSAALERVILKQNGITTLPAQNNLRDGIAAVRRALATREDGRPGLIIDASCSNLLREIEAYRWQPSSVPGEKVPVKHDDHALDALRYLCVALINPVGWHNGASVW
jgi:hypothetical protein